MENETPIGIPILVVIATIGILVFISGIIFFVLFYQKRTIENTAKANEREKKFQQQLTATTIEVTEMERKRIAANLHDDISGLISLVKRNLNGIVKNIKDEATVKEISEQNSELLETTIESIRNISNDLAPPVLIRLGFEEGIIELCQQIQKSGQIEIEFIGSQNELHLPKSTELQLYRIINELMNNILKHSSATKMRVDLINNNSKFEVNIKHNGEGLNNQMVAQLTETSKGIGLKSIQSRANFIHTKINYLVTESDSHINIQVPL